MYLDLFLDMQKIDHVTIVSGDMEQELYVLNVNTTQARVNILYLNITI